MKKHLSGPEGRRQREHEPRAEAQSLAARSVDHAHARDALAVRIVVESLDHAVRAQRQQASLACGRQRRAVAAEVRAGRATALAYAAVVARAAIAQWLGQVGDTADRDPATRKL